MRNNCVAIVLVMICNLAAMQEGYVVQLEDVPQLISVKQWLTLNIPVADEQYKVMMEHAETIARLQAQFSKEDVIKKLFTMQEKEYQSKVSRKVLVHKCLLYGSYIWSVGAIATTLFIGGAGLKCGMSD